MPEAVRDFEYLWVPSFWYPVAGRGDKSFSSSEFNTYLSQIGTKIETFPPVRQYENATGSKRGIITSIFILLMEDKYSTAPELKALTAVSISNDLYGNHLVSCSQMAKGYTWPIQIHSSPAELPNESDEVNLDMKARQKQLLILRSKASQKIPTSVGDSVKVFLEGTKTKGVLVHCQEQ